MRLRAWAAVIAGLIAGRFSAAQNGEVPAIAQGGIVNSASRIPIQEPVGGVAPGSLISIRGFRFGPAAPDTVLVRIRQGDKFLETRASSVREREIQAEIPEQAPLGNAFLQVVRNGNSSRELPILIVPTRFGAFSRNGQGWGRGEISNADGSPNSDSQPARPGEALTIAGTGLGLQTPSRQQLEVLVAGRPSPAVHVLNRTTSRSGVDVIAFALPSDTPEGCNVPLQVSSAPGIYSNGVTLAVSRNGSRCSDHTGWDAYWPKQKSKLAVVGLLHTDLQLGATPRDTATYSADAGFASFAQVDPDASASPLFLFPPLGTCSSFGVTSTISAITSPVEALAAQWGTALDVHDMIAVKGPRGERTLSPSASGRGRYWGILGGHLPVPGSQSSPLFVARGDYEVIATRPTGVQTLHTRVHADLPIIWRNRERFRELDRSQGGAVTWHSARSASGKVVLILAMNADPGTGALGICACLAEAHSEKFYIPPYALANVPPTPAHPRGFPLNLVMLLELPIAPVNTATPNSVDSVLAFAASISGRTVQFK